MSISMHTDLPKGKKHTINLEDISQTEKPQSLSTLKLPGFEYTGKRTRQ